MSTAFGLPISGDINHGTREPTGQRPIEELAPIFQALLDDPNVIEFGWTQYTPHFNDGDVCEFSVGEPWIRTVDDEDVDDIYDLEVRGTHPTLGDHSYVERDKTPEEIEEERRQRATPSYPNPYIPTYTWDRVEREPKYPETLERAKALSKIQHSKYEWGMKATFGDHAQVTVTRDGIRVDEYSHE